MSWITSLTLPLGEDELRLTLPTSPSSCVAALRPHCTGSSSHPASCAAQAALSQGPWPLSFPLQHTTKRWLRPWEKQHVVEKSVFSAVKQPWAPLVKCADSEDRASCIGGWETPLLQGDYENGMKDCIEGATELAHNRHCPPLFFSSFLFLHKKSSEELRPQMVACSFPFLPFQAHLTVDPLSWPFPSSNSFRIPPRGTCAPPPKDSPKLQIQHTLVNRHQCSTNCCPTRWSLGICSFLYLL